MKFEVLLQQKMDHITYKLVWVQGWCLLLCVVHAAELWLAFTDDWKQLDLINNIQNIDPFLENFQRFPL